VDETAGTRGAKLVVNQLKTQLACSRYCGQETATPQRDEEAGMISVAQRTSYPVIPAPRSRFAALTVTDTPNHLSGLDSQLRTLGATAVAHSHGSGDAVPRPLSGADLCILDGGGDCLGELTRLRSAGWRRIVVAIPRTDSEVVRALLSRGVRSVVVAPALTSAPEVPTRTAQDSAVAHSLSEREVQVLQRVADGHSNRQIGQDLCLSALTVKSHLARISRKLGTGDRAQMVAIAYRAGMVH
jgi:DNA-binding CsgD family transcriptional regulator